MDGFNESMLEAHIAQVDRDNERIKKIIRQYWDWHDCMIEMNDLTSREDRKYKNYLKKEYGISEGDLHDER